MTSKTKSCVSVSPISMRQCKADAGNNKANRVRKRQPPRDDGDKNCDKE